MLDNGTFDCAQNTFHDNIFDGAGDFASHSLRRFLRCAVSPFDRVGTPRQESLLLLKVLSSCKRAAQSVSIICEIASLLAMVIPFKDEFVGWWILG